MKVAITHDWLVGGGAERVVEALHKLYPEAPIYTSYVTDEWRQKLDGKVQTGYLQNFGFLRKAIPWLRARWFSKLDLSDYDLVISSSGAEAKFARASEGKLHIAYIHAPTHYYWDRYNDYLKHPGFPKGLNWLARLSLKLFAGSMRKPDYQAAQLPDVLIANSEYTKAKIKQYYGRESTVIHPPVDVERLSDLPDRKRHGFVAAGRQTPYKRIDLAVAACTQLNLPLTVIGNGPDNQKLRKLAGPSVKFVGKVSNEKLREYLASAESFLFPGLDDFGIVAVEAMAAGTPVIAYNGGGALDYVVEGKTGRLFDEQSAESLAVCLQSFKSSDFDTETLKKAAKQFSTEVFLGNMREIIGKIEGKQ